MANAVYSVTPLEGIALLVTYTPAQLVPPLPPHKLGTQVWGSDGKLYVFAQANASITASVAVATVNATTFLATASGGSYTSPPVAMVTGDYGWFAKASV